MTAIQFAVYEKTIEYFKRHLDAEVFRDREFSIHCLAGLLGGVLGSAMTNSLETITVARQTNPEANLAEIIRTERLSLLTQGLIPRVYYNGSQSLMFFAILAAIGKAYNVELNED